MMDLGDWADNMNDEARGEVNGIDSASHTLIVH